MLADNKTALYEAFKVKDPRFDGRIFIAISSTGIYCRPVCGARMPKFENCTFYNTAAEAEQAGYRPCLLCRPELAPGTSISDATSNLLYRATRVLEENCGSGMNLDEFANSLGCSSRHLRRIFMDEYNVTPVQYLQTCRLLLAKNLLTSTNLSILDIAIASGFGSVRRFNDVFKKHYNLTPTSLRKKSLNKKIPNENINLSLGYRPPFRWKEIIGFLSTRAIKGVELVENGEYLRTVILVNSKGEKVSGWIEISHNEKKKQINVNISETLLSVIPQILSLVRNLFDLYSDPTIVYESIKSMNDIRPGLAVLGTRVPGSFNAFEMVVRAVLGQQITIKAAGTLASRIVENYGESIDTGINGLTHTFPAPEKILSMGDSIRENFGVLGVISARSNTIYELAKAINNGTLNLSMSSQPEEEIKMLMNIKGIGSWTAKYIAMRTMGYPDAFLETDVGVKKALYEFNPKEIVNMAENWRPWRSYATVNLWNSL